MQILPQNIATSQTLLFSFTLLLSATLLFWVEPMIAKMILPSLGGAPQVWNTCMMFFQGILLLGYYYAHVATRLLPFNKQVILHLIFMLAGLLFLPVHISWLGAPPPTTANPIPWLLTLLILAIGTPMLVISATAPMLQYWFSKTRHPQAKDPYFLYVASNAGSMLALIGYLFLLEPHLTLNQQAHIWSWFYFGLILLISSCALLVIYLNVSSKKISDLDVFAKKEKKDKLMPASPLSDNFSLTLIPTMGIRIRWILLSFVPSSLLLGITHYITTEIAAVPLLWIAPLILYLLTFILVFARKPLISHTLIVNIQPYTLLPLLTPPFIFLLSSSGSSSNVLLMLTIHLAIFFITAMMCHGELAKSRPAINYLTEFYLWIAIGGFLGSVFNTLLAPLLFNSLFEYPLMLIAACLLRPNLDKSHPQYFYKYNFLLPLAIFLVFFCVYLLKIYFLIPFSYTSFVFFLTSLSTLAIILVVGLFSSQPLRFGLGVIAIFLSYHLFSLNQNVEILLQLRNFFGITAVKQQFEKENNGKINILYSGTTIHGTQLQNPQQKKNITTYYSILQPVFALLDKKYPRLNVAIAGLGTGTIICYSRTKDAFSFFEINPEMVKIAKNRRYFSFLEDCGNEKTQIIMGDARLSIAKEPAAKYDFIILDAFSSDSIPVHLMTLEAVQTYLQKLTEHGLLAFHISNRYLDLTPILSAIAQRLNLSIIKLENNNMNNYIYSSLWVILARHYSDLENLIAQHKWEKVPCQKDATVWTDDFSNIISAIKK